LKRFFFYLFFFLHFTGLRAAGFSSNDTSTVNRLNKLAESKTGADPDSAFYYAEEAIKLSRKINYLRGLGEGLLQTGLINFTKGKSDGAVKNFDEAILIYKQLNYQRGLSAVYTQYGSMYNRLANYDKALEFLNLAMTIDQRLKDERALAECYKHVGVVNFSRGKLSEALDFYYKGLFIAIKDHYDIPAAEIYNDIGAILENIEAYNGAIEYFKKSLSIFAGTGNIHALGTVYQNIDNCLLNQGEYDSAIFYINKAYQAARTLNDPDEWSGVYDDLGIYWASKNQFKKAKSYLDSSLNISVKNKIKYDEGGALLSFAKIYNQQKNYRKAYGYAIRARRLADSLGGLYYRTNAALELNRTCAGLGRITEAYAALSEYFELKNGLQNGENVKKLTTYNYQLNHLFQKRISELQEDKKNLLFSQNARFHRITTQFLFIIIIILIAVIVIFFLKHRNEQKINRLLKTQNVVVLKQKADLDEQTEKLNNLNSLKDRLIAILAHDLRAPLSTLRGLFDLLQDHSISHQELLDMIPSVLIKLEYTSDFLDTLLFWINSQMENFGKGVKKFSVKEITGKESQNLHDQATRKGINLIINVPDKLAAMADPDSVRIVIRNLVTNAIKFSEPGGIIEVSASLKDDHIVLNVKDTGVGMTAKQLKDLFKGKVESKRGTHNELGTGMGLLFCKDLIEKCNGEIWASSERGVGSEFSFIIPAVINQSASPGMRLGHTTI
jgi:two-component system sensor histidine kinase/response regulator